MTQEGDVVYVAGSSDIKIEVRIVQTSSNPQISGGASRTSVSTQSMSVPTPNVKHVQEYLKASSYGMTVKLLLAGLLCFTRWDDTDPKSFKSKLHSNQQKYIGLTTPT